jgi:hypothetical protein
MQIADVKYLVPNGILCEVCLSRPLHGVGLTSILREVALGGPLREVALSSGVYMAMSAVKGFHIVINVDQVRVYQNNPLVCANQDIIH